jgi:ATP-dependent 26S proteasome regulatory subunit
MKFSELINSYFNAGYAALSIQSFEEDRVLREIGKVNDHRKAGKIVMYEWDCSGGLRGFDGNKLDHEIPDQPETNDTGVMLKTLDDMLNNKKIFNNRIIILKDFHLQFEKGPIRISYMRVIRNMMERLRARNFMLIFISPAFNIPPELEKDIQTIDFALPNTQDTEDSLKFVIESGKVQKEIPYDSETFSRAVEAAKGMTENEMQNAFALALVQSRPNYGQSFVDAVFAEKVNQLKKSGLLEYIKTDISFEDVGGLQGLKKWIMPRRLAYSKKARDFGVPIPKGMLVAGLPGGGKTLLAKAVSSVFGCPLFKLDLGGLFGHLVGDTEANFRRVTALIDSLGLCVILIDECEKYLNESAVEGKGDSGTSSRSFGTWLTWMNDRLSHAFIIMTSNDHTILPAALVRKGRVDEMFWVDLPTSEERIDIFKVVLKKFKNNPNNYDLGELSQFTEDFSGAEIDEVVKLAIYRAFAADADRVTHEHIRTEIDAFKPYARFNKAKIDEMRSKAQNKLKFATEDGEAADFNLDKALRGIQLDGGKK